MGGGGDGGYQERQDAQDRQKQLARNALNVAFGVAPTASTVSPAAFSGGSSGAVDADGMPYASAPYDQAGYDAAIGAESGQSSEAAKNRAALDALYGSVRTNAYNAGKRGLDEGRENAARDTKFELFARGLNGGSVDVDQNALLGRKYTEGLTNLGGKADSAAADLRTGDENARLTLLQSIDNGMDQGSAVSSALAQMRNNSDKASAEAIGTDVGDLFSDGAFLYSQGRKARGEQSAADYARNYGVRNGAGKLYPNGVVSPG